MRSILTADDLAQRSFLNDLFQDIYWDTNSLTMRDRILASVFLEPSTRTRLSFESAFLRLGGKVITVADGSSSSVAKGERLRDTVRTMAQYADVMVLRTEEAGSLAELAKIISIPLINAGDGWNEHPTQALLDVFTLYQRHGDLDGADIAICGDLLHSRTVHSLLKLLNVYEGVKLHLVPHPRCSIVPNDYIIGDSLFGGFRNYSSMMDLLNRGIPLKAIYLTRLQTERWRERIEPSSNYHLRTEHMRLMPENCLILHPLPRGSEIGEEIDNDYRAVYSGPQIAAGLKVRMAIFRRILE